MGIEWAKFKTYKAQSQMNEGQTNLGLLVGFLRDTQGLHIYDEIFEEIESDELGKTMLQKNGISNADALMKLYFKR
jgi:hypothetical protein